MSLFAKVYRSNGNVASKGIFFWCCCRGGDDGDDGGVLKLEYDFTTLAGKAIVRGCLFVTWCTGCHVACLVTPTGGTVVIFN